MGLFIFEEFYTQFFRMSIENTSRRQVNILFHALQNRYFQFVFRPDGERQIGTFFCQAKISGLLRGGRDR